LEVFEQSVDLKIEFSVLSTTINFLADFCSPISLDRQRKF